MHKRIFWLTLIFTIGFVPMAWSADYDAQLAQKLGADDYGMRQYVLVILTTGPQDSELTAPEQRKQIFQGHFANMSKMAEAGKLVVAGPLSGSPPQRGLFILNVKTLEEAEKLVKTDPAVAAGIFNYQLTKYYGSAALMQVNTIHKRIQKTKV